MALEKLTCVERKTAVVLSREVVLAWTRRFVRLLLRAPGVGTGRATISERPQPRM